MAALLAFLAPVGTAVAAYAAQYGLGVLFRVAPAVSAVALAFAFHLLDLHFGGNLVTRTLLGASVLGLGISLFLLGFEVGQMVPKLTSPATTPGK